MSRRTGWARLLSQVLRDGAEREPSIWSQPLGHHVEADEPIVGTAEGLGTVTPNSPREATGDELLDLLGWKPALDLPRTPRGNTTGPLAGPASYAVAGHTEDSVMELRYGSPNRRIDQISPLGILPVSHFPWCRGV